MTMEATQYNTGCRGKPGMTMEATQYNTGCRVKARYDDGGGEGAYAPEWMPGQARYGDGRYAPECRNHDRARLASPLVGMAGQGDAFCQVLYCHLQGIGKR